jgi:PadR family transcriptional regulator
LVDDQGALEYRLAQHLDSFLRSGVHKRKNSTITTSLIRVEGIDSFHLDCEPGDAHIEPILLFTQKKCAILCWKPKGPFPMKQKTDVQQGTLALMVLKTIEVLGPLHGYGIARRIEQISGDLLSVNQGTLYPVLLRLEQEGAIASDWGASENNRRARYYRLTRDGHRQLQAELQEWHQTTEIIARFLAAKAEDVS